MWSTQHDYGRKPERSLLSDSAQGISPLGGQYALTNEVVKGNVQVKNGKFVRGGSISVSFLKR